MNRDLYRLIKGLKRLSAQDLARVQQFINQLRAAELREVPIDLKAVPPPAAMPREADAAPVIAGPTDSSTGSSTAVPSADGEALRDREPPSPFWRRRAFQDIPAEDLRPIADLYREANQSRASARQRFGAC